ncbi:MAG TPA: thymidine phosphorylase, partial [Melioribacteraceae bacterium]|nr:thymidine phosphorylase [Melioribacteraceae bacterium]
GYNIGNWLEVVESIDILKGKDVPYLTELCLQLAGTMIFFGDKAGSVKEGIEKAKALISNGKAYEKFVEIVKLQGGDISFIEKPEKYPKAKYSAIVKFNSYGYVKGIDTYNLGMASLLLGAGRLKKEDVIDFKAGIIFTPKIGDFLKEGDVIAELFSSRKITQDDINKVISSIELSEEKVKPAKLIHKVIQ